jgi:hypothetical protein
VSADLRQTGPETWSNGHLRFDPVDETDPFYRRRWDIRLHSAAIAAQPVAVVKWHGPWHEYVLYTSGPGFLFAHDCLEDIIQFLRDRTAEAK